MSKGVAATATLALATSLGTGGCKDDPQPAAWDPLADSGTGGTGISTRGDEALTGGGDDSAFDEESTDGEADPDDAADDSSGGEIPVDCSPAWTTPWIGSPCVGDGDCAYDGGECLLPADGFVCGTCSQPCTVGCPDTDGAPVTYCINGTDVGLTDAGYCLSKCDPAILPADGCRDGYACNVLERFDASSADWVCIPDEFDVGGMDHEYIDEIDHEFLIEYLGGDPVNPLAYGPDLDSFQQYLDAVGVQHTTAAEIVEPYNRAVATMCGYTILLPAQDQWEKAGALALFTDELTELIGEPIFMRNWWRPPCYNDAVGGAPTGDHPDADAVDLDFMSATARAEAQRFLCETYWEQDIVTPEEIAPGSDLDPRLNMSIGLGAVTIHLGVLSAGGRRSWTYGGYTDEPDSGQCW